MEQNNVFGCSHCNKTYSKKKSLLSHQLNIHGVKKYKSSASYPCRYCKNEYSHYQSRWSHEKTCSEKIKQETMAAEMERIRMESERIRLENERIIKEKTEEINRLQKKLLSSKRIDNKTFKAVNKILIERSLQNSNNNNTINSNNNTINNNIQICSIGNEDLMNVLTVQQKKLILDSRLCSLEKIVEITHCGEMNQFKNVLITNLKDNYAYKYDDKKGYFITVTKEDLFNDIINNRVTDIEDIYHEMKTTNKIDEKTKKLIQDFLDKMENNETPFYDNETKYDNFKTYKTDTIMILLYNNQNKITQDIATMIHDKKENL